jgi:hypothetical protein
VEESYLLRILLGLFFLSLFLNKLGCQLWRALIDEILCDIGVEVFDKSLIIRLTKAAPVIVGLPLLTSSRNYSFWLELTGASGLPCSCL